MKPISYVELELLRQSATMQYLPANAQLLRQGEEVRTVWLIETGLASLIRTEANGDEVMPGLRKAGHLLGAASLFVGDPVPFTVTTLTACNVYTIPAAAFLNLVSTNSAFSLYLLRAVCERYLESVTRQSLFKTNNARGLVAILILELTAKARKQAGQEVRFQFPLKMQDTAKILGLSREHFRRTLSWLEKEGILREDDRGWFYISDFDRLRQKAGAETSNGIIFAGGGQEIRE